MKRIPSYDEGTNPSSGWRAPELKTLFVALYASSGLCVGPFESRAEAERWHENQIDEAHYDDGAYGITKNDTEVDFIPLAKP